MIDHVSVAVADISRATAFYSAVLGALGHRPMFTSEATAGFGKDYPEFWVNLRSGMAPLGGASGCHVCLRARDAAAVDAFHAAAIANGGSDDGAPGLRPDYAPNYYAAFVRDPDGNRIEAVSFVDTGS